MLKLAARAFDIYDDLPDLKHARAVAAKCASAQVADPTEIEQLRDAQFALLLKTASGALLRKYPVHNADSTKLSRAYFDVCGEGLPAEIRDNVTAKLAAADQVHGLAQHGLDDATVATIMDRVAYVDAAELQPAKVAAWDSEYWGLTIRGKNYFPLHTAELVKQAEARFVQTGDGLQPHERFLYARNIAKRASALSVSLPSSSPIHNYTGDDVNLDNLKVALLERKRILKAAGIGTAIVDQLLQASGCALDRGDIEDDDVWNYRVAKHASLERLPADRIIQTLQGIDKLAGLGHSSYMRGLPDPFSAVYKRAEAMSQTTVDGVDLASVDLDTLRTMFDDELVNEFAQNPVSVYSHLPDPIKQAIRSLASSKKEPAQVSSGGNPQAILAPAYSSAAGTSSF